jgi:hypothetical protein
LAVKSPEGRWARALRSSRVTTWAQWPRLDGVAESVARGQGVGLDIGALEHLVPHQPRLDGVGLDHHPRACPTNLALSLHRSHRSTASTDAASDAPNPSRADQAVLQAEMTGASKRSPAERSVPEAARRRRTLPVTGTARRSI